jgi:hypothetical protein
MEGALRYRLIRRQKVQTLTSLNLSVIMMSVHLIEQMKTRLNQYLILLEWNPQSSFHINPWSMGPSLNAGSAGCLRWTLIIITDRFKLVSVCTFCLLISLYLFM